MGGGFRPGLKGGGGEGVGSSTREEGGEVVKGSAKEEGGEGDRGVSQGRMRKGVGCMEERWGLRKGLKGGRGRKEEERGWGFSQGRRSGDEWVGGSAMEERGKGVGARVGKKEERGWGFYPGKKEERGCGVQPGKKKERGGLGEGGRVGASGQAEGNRGMEEEERRG